LYVLIGAYLFVAIGSDWDRLTLAAGLAIVILSWAVVVGMVTTVWQAWRQWRRK
jgi:hypothetical protein